jgi:hypothetical protein
MKRKSRVSSSRQRSSHRRRERLVNDFADAFFRESLPELTHDPYTRDTIVVAADYLAVRFGDPLDWARLDPRDFFLTLSHPCCGVSGEQAVEICLTLYQLYEWLGETGRLDSASAQRVIGEIVAHRNDFVGRLHAAEVLEIWKQGLGGPLQRVATRLAPSAPPTASALN